MNTEELRQAERNEVKALRETINNDNFMDVMDEIDAVREKYRVIRRENTIIKDWGFPAEEWATLSNGAKTIVIDMVEEAELHEALRENLQTWLGEAP